MSLGGMLGSLALNAVLGRKKNKKNKKSSMAQIIKIFGEMAFLPSQKISPSRIQQGYRGGVNPITPYDVPTAYTGGRVRGLFIGINYRGTKNQLGGCINDVTMLLGTLNSIHFPLQEACILVDDPNFRGCSGAPTRDNIITHMQWLVHDARPGDVFFFHYSGHGSQTEDRSGDEEDGMDETLVPLDYQQAGCIIDDDIYSILIARLPPGARLTAVIDCCHSGSIMDLQYEYAGFGNGQFKMMNRPTHPPHHAPDVVLLSGCADNQTSADVGNATTFGVSNQHGKGTSGGAATNAFSHALTNTKGLSYVQLLEAMRSILRERRYVQVPQMSSTKPIDLRTPFSLFGSLNDAPQPMRPAMPAPTQQAVMPNAAPVPHPCPMPTNAPYQNQTNQSYQPNQPNLPYQNPTYHMPQYPAVGTAATPTPHAAMATPQVAQYAPNVAAPQLPHQDPPQKGKKGSKNNYPFQQWQQQPQQQPMYGAAAHPPPTQHFQGL
eukprot:GILI01004243.1.p1 GENE.GILI01004243.1~~GILI01004243.1.p1  ORF type:complete len:491 (+),score=94.15 GILI01004243.1:45-1517(+)